MKKLNVSFEPADAEPILGGVGYTFKFDNGYGASVICHMGSYGGKDGLWELAVLSYIPESFGDGWHIDYTTEITNDVIGHLSDADVDYYLQRISQL